ncbi:MAG: hypothetical protein VYA34_15785 [Myxococcota bacterium]|nr:hypothetical protein [Myxococcota bacterium]
MKYLIPSIGLLILTNSACQHLDTKHEPLHVTPSHQNQLEEQFVGKAFVLGTTHIGIRFESAPGKLFLDARSSEIADFRNTTGVAVTPKALPPQVIPAGSPITVKKIVYPQQPWYQFMLPASTEDQSPSGHIWLHVELGDRTAVLKQPTDLYLLLPSANKALQTITRAARESLKPSRWVLTWLNHRSPELQQAISSRQVLQGMSRAEMLVSVGPPKNRREATNVTWTADYGDLQVELQGNLVTKIFSRVEEAKKRIEAMKTEALAQVEAQAAQEAREKAKSAGADPLAEPSE